MNKQYIHNLLIFIFLPIFLPISIFTTISYLTDLKVWKEIEKHTDEFVYDNTSMRGRVSTVTLYDGDTYVCEVLLNNRTKEASVFNKMSIIASSFNIINSKKLYKKLIVLVPPEEINEFDAKGEVLNYLKKMKK